MPINSVILAPRSGDSIVADKDGMITASGYAVPGGSGGPVTKVEISVDGQRTWTTATFQVTPSKWSWALWQARIEVGGGSHRFFSRAFDRAGNEQAAEPQWNLRGVAYNGYGESRDVIVVP